MRGSAIVVLLCVLTALACHVMTDDARARAADADDAACPLAAYPCHAGDGDAPSADAPSADATDAGAAPEADPAPADAPR